MGVKAIFYDPCCDWYVKLYNVDGKIKKTFMQYYYEKTRIPEVRNEKSRR